MMIQYKLWSLTTSETLACTHDSRHNAGIPFLKTLDAALRDGVWGGVRLSGSD